MQATTFKISKMDCPSEEQLIRMKLAGLANINSLDFDIPKRQLRIYHTDSYEVIFQNLNELKFDTYLMNSVTLDSFESGKDNSGKERKLLWQVLAINVFFFILELCTGFLSNSMGLLADSLDMLADSIVYALALFAVGGSLTRKNSIAKLASYFQFTLAILGIFEVLRQFLQQDALPDYKTMVGISLLALIGNGICLYLLQKSQSKEAHMQASMIFTSNDVIVNLGVILAGGLVFLTKSPYPDLIVGAIVFFIVSQGAFKILRLSSPNLK